MMACDRIAWFVWMLINYHRITENEYMMTKKAIVLLWYLKCSMSWKELNRWEYVSFEIA